MSGSTDLPAQVLNVALGCTNLQSLFLRSLEILFLANIGHEANHLISLFLRAMVLAKDKIGHSIADAHHKVLEDTAGVKPARVGEANFSFGHDCWCSGVDCERCRERTGVLCKSSMARVWSRWSHLVEKFRGCDSMDRPQLFF
jgi:hypothetical protein